MPAFHVLACVEIVMISCFYSLILFKKIFPILPLVLVAFNCANTLFLQDVHIFNSLAWTFNVIIIILLGFTYLFKLYNSENYTPVERNPDFVINAGFLIYASGSLFTYLMGTEILSGQPEGFFYNAWIIQCVSNISKNFIVSIGLWLTK